jgi:hypothetical protein
VKFISFQFGIMKSLLEGVDETFLVVCHNKLYLDVFLSGVLLLDAVGQPLVRVFFLGGQQGKGTRDDLVYAGEAHGEDHMGKENVLSDLRRKFCQCMISHSW